jgi:hypothetical protein
MPQEPGARQAAISVPEIAANGDENMSGACCRLAEAIDAAADYFDEIALTHPKESMIGVELRTAHTTSHAAEKEPEALRASSNLAPRLRAWLVNVRLDSLTHNEREEIEEIIEEAEKEPEVRAWECEDHGPLTIHEVRQASCVTPIHDDRLTGRTCFACLHALIRRDA